ncbi:unnamed protein product [Parnassius apollo]|uniref:(apollo) hypothetical protein n=1 Tax=Parnassius apollo TaxID=110799 RepID=A0A8S3WW68_PARAO|nr:unnamed protein product [Parnassius apollo]
MVESYVESRYVNEDDVTVESDASIDDDYVQKSDHDSKLEQNALSSEESEAEEAEIQQRFFSAKDKTTKCFKVKGRPAVRTCSQNIVSEAPGPKVLDTCLYPDNGIAVIVSS